MFRMSTRPVGANDELFQRREGRWRKDLVADACIPRWEELGL